MFLFQTRSEGKAEGFHTTGKKNLFVLKKYFEISNTGYILFQSLPVELPS